MSIKYKKDDQNIVILTMDMAGRTTNVINETFILAFLQVLERLSTEESLAGVILTSAKRTFMAGGDLDWLIQFADAAEAFHAVEKMKAAFRKLELLGKPVVAALNGTALGGGLEFALACNYRIALDDDHLRFGFPEVSLGLLPGCGGVTRLTRLLGLQAALPYLMEGKKVTPQVALSAGFIDELATDKADLMVRATTWILDNPSAAQPWDKPRYRLPGGAPTNPRVAQMLAIAPAMLKKKTYGNYPAPEAIMNAAVEGAIVDFDTACHIESRYFAQIATGNVAKNMISAFWFQLNQINAGESRPPEIPASKTLKVGVLGAGMMGHGIAYVTANAGLDVILMDISLAKAQAGKASIAKIMDKHVNRERMTSEQKQEILNRINITINTDDLRGCDLVIEAVFEDRTLKARVTQAAEGQLDNTAVFASNTSTLPITSLAEYSTRPANFIGLHFFSPVHKMKLVEIICGELTSNTTLAKAFDFVRKINKIPIVVNDSRGFYTSRVFATYLKEGLALLLEGQHPRAIESAGLKAGMPVGPLAIADEVSLSLMAHINEQTHQDLATEGQTMAIHPADTVIQIMIEQFDRLGKAHGAGFYEYPADQPKHLWPQLHNLFPQKNGNLSQHDMIERLMFIQALEAARCYEEGVLRSVADANIGSIFGWGFAPFKGGTLQYINDYGVGAFVDRSRQLVEQVGQRFDPPLLLNKMADAGQKF